MNDQSNVHTLPVPPQNIDAERAVLGALLISNDRFEDVIALIGVADFYQHRHRVIFEAMRNLYDRREKADLITVKDFLERIGELENVGGISYVAQMAHETPHSINAASYAGIVRDCAVLRRLLRCSADIQDMVYERGETPAGEVMETAQRMMHDLARSTDRNEAMIPVRDAANDAFSRIEELYNDPDQGPLTGVPSGFADLDALTSGFQRSDLVVIAGRPSHGKTTLAMNIAEYAAIEENLKVAVFSLEMPAVQLAMRSLSALSNVELSRLRSGDIGDGPEGMASWERLSHALNQLSEAPIFIDATPGVAPLQISAISRRMKREHGLDLIVVDYLQLLQMKDDRDNRATELSNITRELKFLAKELDVPVLALSQLNRQVEQRPNKRPMMSDLRDSGAIEQDADVIMFVYREEMYSTDTRRCGIADIIIAKHRNGATDDIELRLAKEFTRFESISHNEPVEGLDYHDHI